MGRTWIYDTCTYFGYKKHFCFTVPASILVPAPYRRRALETTVISKSLQACGLRLNRWDFRPVMVEKHLVLRGQACGTRAVMVGMSGSTGTYGVLHLSGHNALRTNPVERG